MDNLKRCENCGFRSPIFRFLDPDDLKLINDKRYEVVFEPGENIFKQGTPCTHVASFAEGMAKMYVEGSNKRNLIIRFIKPQEFISGVGLFVNSKHHYSVSALTRSSVCFIDSNVFIEILRKNATFSEAYLRLTQEAMVQSLEKLVHINQKNQQARVAEAILYLSEEIHKKDSFNMIISKTELADMAGISRESNTKIIKEMCREEIICISGKVITINNPHRLRQIRDRG